ncbi:hypothetical protein BVX97_01240 [bacterium E08(2017)]|nr:hypothetical protein BVX97_01240 [bacterium E08(2017)]
MAKKVLIVDDEVTLLKTLKDGLELEGQYNVRIVNDSRQAIDQMMEFMPDVVILDVMMPDMDGGEVAAKMLDYPMLKDIPVIFQTAVMSRDEEAKHKPASSREHFLIKPVSLDEVARTIEALT